MILWVSVFKLCGGGGLLEKVRRVAKKHKISSDFNNQNTEWQHLIKTIPKNYTRNSQNCTYSRGLSSVYVISNILARREDL